MAAELGVNLVTTSGPVLERSGDLAAILTNLSRHDILFVDEIHRMPVSVEEVLYPAMEDFKLDLVIGQGPGRPYRQAGYRALHAGGRHHAARSAVFTPA